MISGAQQFLRAVRKDEESFRVERDGDGQTDQPRILRRLFPHHMVSMTNRSPFLSDDACQ